MCVCFVPHWRKGKSRMYWSNVSRISFDAFAYIFWGNDEVDWIWLPTRIRETVSNNLCMDKSSRGQIGCVFAFSYSCWGYDVIVRVLEIYIWAFCMLFGYTFCCDIANEWLVCNGCFRSYKSRIHTSWRSHRAFGWCLFYMMMRTNMMEFSRYGTEGYIHFTKLPYYNICAF